MVAIPESVTQQRCRNLAAQNNIGAGSFKSNLPRPPRITYGRKDFRPLSLTAKQFRADTYAIPSDDEDAQLASDALLQATADRTESSEDSELSDAEPLPTRASRDVRKIGTPAATSGARDAVSGTSKGTTHRKALVAKSVRQPVRKTVQPRKPAQQTRVKALGKNTPKSKLATPARRLPANELFLVASPPDDTANIDPVSSLHRVQSEDPIRDSSSSPRKRGVSPIDSNAEASPSKKQKAPLSAIRKRLKTPKWRYKSLRSLRKQQVGQVSMWTGNVFEPRGRDGFNESELAIAPQAKIQRRHKRKVPLLLGFGFLQLRNGPLPEVKFEPSASELKTELPCDDGDSLPLEQQRDNDPFAAPITSPNHNSRRRVSFSDRVRENLITAQLSSISAPERIPSDSEESDIDSDEDRDLEEADADASDDDEHGLAGKEDQIAVEADPRMEKEVDQGVSLDFRRGSTPGHLPKAPSSARRRALIEVNEPIIEAPDLTHQSSGYVLGRPVQPEHTISTRPHRPRSILKNSTPAVPDSTTRPEETAANTRRNSIVDISESRYFTDAASALRAPDPARHKVVPRRPSCFRNDEAEIEIFDTDAVVTETSPEAPAYMDMSDLHVLRRSSEAVWTSSSLPRPATDLKTLTRSVSRENGTLSQCVRRRPSLPFQSPTKVR